jgi:opacity protein-like surface antigen
MTKKFTLLLLLCIAALAISPALYAQQGPSTWPDYKSYVVVKGGVFYPQVRPSDLDVGFSGELAYGYRFGEYLAVELSSGYFGTSRTFSVSGLGSGVSLKESVDAVPLTAAIKIIVPIKKQFELYFLAGPGAYFVNSKASFSGAALSAPSSDNKTLVGGFLGTGVAYNITPRVFVGLEGKYLWPGYIRMTTSVGGLPVTESHMIQGALFTANVGFRF